LREAATAYSLLQASVEEAEGLPYLAWEAEAEEVEEVVAFRQAVGILLVQWSGLLVSCFCEQGAIGRLHAATQLKK
jgi:hypothetical protein